MKTEIDRNRT